MWNQAQFFFGTASLKVLRAAGIRAIQSIPLISHSGEVCGVLTTQWDVPHAPNEHDLWKFDLLAKQAAELIQYKMDGERLQESKSRVELLDEINSLLLSSDEPESIISLIAEKVMRYLHCDIFCNYVWDETKGQLHLNACGGIDIKKAEGLKWLDKGVAICGCVARDGCRIVSENVQENGDPRAELVRSMGIQAYACHPLRMGEEIAGTLSLGTKNRKTFTEGELALMSTVANKVSLAIQKKQVERKLKTALSARDEFLSIASHELKTPLTTIQLLVQIQGKILQAGEQAALSRDRLINSNNTLLKEVKRLAILIDDLLDVTRISQGKLSLNIEVSNLSKLVKDILSREGQHLDGTGIQLKENIQEGIILPIDELRIDQVITNLISNAIKYAPGHPLQVNLATEGNKVVRLDIIDRGPGIAKDDMDKLFTRFHRIENKTAIPGLGLGLYITKQIIGAHDGSMNVKSELGEGTHFTITLPLRRKGE